MKLSSLYTELVIPEGFDDLIKYIPRTGRNYRRGRKHSLASKMIKQVYARIMKKMWELAEQPGSRFTKETVKVVEQRLATYSTNQEFVKRVIASANPEKEAVNAMSVKAGLNPRREEREG